LNQLSILVIGILSVGLILGFSFTVSAEENLIPTWIKNTAAGVQGLVRIHIDGLSGGFQPKVVATQQPHLFGNQLIIQRHYHHQLVQP